MWRGSCTELSMEHMLWKLQSAPCSISWYWSGKYSTEMQPPLPRRALEHNMKHGGPGTRLLRHGSEYPRTPEQAPHERRSSDDKAVDTGRPPEGTGPTATCNKGGLRDRIRCARTLDQATTAPHKQRQQRAQAQQKNARKAGRTARNPSAASSPRWRRAALRRRCADPPAPPPGKRNPLAPPRDGSTPRADRYPPPSSSLFPISFFLQSALGQRASLVERLVLLATKTYRRRSAYATNAQNQVAY